VGGGGGGGGGWKKKKKKTKPPKKIKNKKKNKKKKKTTKHTTQRIRPLPWYPFLEKSTLCARPDAAPTHSSSLLITQTSEVHPCITAQVQLGTAQVLLPAVWRGTLGDNSHPPPSLEIFRSICHNWCLCLVRIPLSEDEGSRLTNPAALDSFVPSPSYGALLLGLSIPFFLTGAVT